MLGRVRQNYVSSQTNICYELLDSRLFSLVLNVPWADKTLQQLHKTRIIHLSKKPMWIRKIIIFSQSNKEKRPGAFSIFCVIFQPLAWRFWGEKVGKLFVGSKIKGKTRARIYAVHRLNLVLWVSIFFYRDFFEWSNGLKWNEGIFETCCKGNKTPSAILGSSKFIGEKNRRTHVMSLRVSYG